MKLHDPSKYANTRATTRAKPYRNFTLYTIYQLRAKYCPLWAADSFFFFSSRSYRRDTWTKLGRVFSSRHANIQFTRIFRELLKLCYHYLIRPQNEEILSRLDLNRTLLGAREKFRIVIHDSWEPSKHLYLGLSISTDRNSSFKRSGNPHGKPQASLLRRDTLRPRASRSRLCLVKKQTLISIRLPTTSAERW